MATRSHKETALNRKRDPELMTERPHTAPLERIRTGLRRHGHPRPPSPVEEALEHYEVSLTDGNRVILFDSGQEGLEAILLAIERAEKRVHFEVYIFRADEMGRSFLDALTRKALEGVEVRLICDGFGSQELSPTMLAPLRNAGGEVMIFNPFSRILPGWAPRQRDHRKILVIDGKLGFTGGLNIGNEYAGGANPATEEDRGWRDTHLQLEGPVVRDLEAVFLESWFRASGPDLPWEEILREAPAPCGTVRCGVLADGPDYRRRRMRDLLRWALQEISHSARFASPYFVPGRRLMRALDHAKENGIEIELLVTGSRTTHPSLQHAARAFAVRLAAHGIHVFEYIPAMMHAKVAIFDDQWAIVGTSNLDRQSLEHSYEVNIIIEGGSIPRQLSQTFDRDLASSRRLDTSVLANRTVLEKAIDWILAVVLRFLHA